jgi:hypothetical protein
MDPSPQELVCTTCGSTVRGDTDTDAVGGAPGGDTADADPVAVARLTWTRATERGEVVWTCDRCSRAHLRSIEAKLDQAWW